MTDRADGRAEAAAERLEVVGELASLINTTYDLNEIFQKAILKLTRVLSFRRASVVLLSDDRTHYHLHTLYDAERGGFISKEEKFPLDHGFPGQVIRTGTAMRVDEHMGSEGIRAEGENKVSVLIVPLRVDGEVIGTLNLGAGASAAYRDEDLQLAVLLGRPIETSLHYSKLLATIERQRGELAVEHARVQSERNRLEALIEAVDAAVLMVSDNRVVYANRAMAQLVGLPWEVVMGSPIQRINRALSRSLANPKDLDVQISALEGGGGQFRDRVELVFPKHLVCQRTGATVRGPEGEVLGYLVVYRDVTREAEAEAAKDEFVSMVSHELRTPLTSVKTSLSLLVKGAAGTVSEEMGSLLEIALRNLQRLIRLVDDLLDLSRIESGRVVTKLVPVSLGGAVTGAVDSVRDFARDRGVRLECQSTEDGTLVLGDADRLEQVIVNLLSNAIKFSPEDGAVGLQWWTDGAHAVLEITDAGPGIPADQLEAVFDKFRQLEMAATRQHGGAGLGLPISRSIVDQFGGRLWAESDRGRGARMMVRLRLAHEVPEVGGREVPAVAGGPRSVFIVDRDADLRSLYRTQFEQDGVGVTMASHGVEALRVLEEYMPDVLIVGIQLADMHGLEFLQQLRQIPSLVNLPALLVGAGADPTQAVSYGADGWVAGDADDLVSEARRLATAPRRPVVLFIEDDPAVRGGLSRLLRRAGYACLQAASGELGLDLARTRRPHLVVTDLHLPGIDGLEVLKELRADVTLADVPAIVVTGYSHPRAVEVANALGADVMAKPVEATAFVRQIRDLMNADRENGGGTVRAAPSSVTRRKS